MTMGMSRRARTGGTVLLKTGWSAGMVVASHGLPPLCSPAQRTVTASTVLLLEQGVEVEGVVAGAGAGAGAGAAAVAVEAGG